MTMRIPEIITALDKIRWMCWSGTCTESEAASLLKARVEIEKVTSGLRSESERRRRMVGAARMALDELRGDRLTGTWQETVDALEEALRDEEAS
jgi:hypothetical protein